MEMDAKGPEVRDRGTADLAHVSSRIELPSESLSLIRLLTNVVKNPIKTWPSAVYTAPLFPWSVLGRKYLFVMAPDLIKEVLVGEPETFEKGIIARRALEPALGDAILTSEGARWRWQRRTAAPIFRQESIRRFVPLMIAVAERTRDRWLFLPAGSEIDVAREMVRTTFDIIFETRLSSRGSINRPAIEQAVTEYLNATSWLMLLTMIGAPRWIPYPGAIKVRRGITYLRKVLDGLVADARRNPTGRDDLLSLLIDAKDPETGHSMNDEDIRDNLLTFITAGHETTALALTWTLYLLSRHPTISQRVRGEIALVTEGSPLAAG